MSHKAWTYSEMYSGLGLIGEYHAGITSCNSRSSSKYSTFSALLCLAKYLFWAIIIIIIIITTRTPPNQGQWLRLLLLLIIIITTIIIIIVFVFLHSPSKCTGLKLGASCYPQPKMLELYVLHVHNPSNDYYYYHFL